jgi:transposase
MSSLPQVSPSAEMKLAASPPRRIHSVEKKRRIVEETLLPNASVARIARAHGVNANQVFFWRKQYQQGLLGTAPPPAALLPVQISDLVSPESIPTPVTRKALVSSQQGAEAAPTGTIHLELTKAKLRIEGVVDPAARRTLLEGLLG